MAKDKIDRLFLILIIFISSLLVFDLFFNKGHSAHSDGRVHITTMAMFHRAMLLGEWKPTWTDWFANYGLPIPIVAHQLISYMGAWLTFLTHNVITSWKIVALIAATLSNIAFYYFLRIYFKPLPSFIAVFLYNVAPYRILNLYVREALPEFFASVFFPLVLIALYLFVKKKKWWALPALTVITTGLALSHPMMLVVSSFIVAPYFLFLLKDERSKLKPIILSLVMGVWGLLIAAYYLIPLNIEIKYFYYGMRNHFSVGQVLHLKNFVDPHWYYFYENDILHRANFMTPGVFELFIIALGAVFVIRRIIKKKKWQPDMLDLAAILGGLILFLTTNYASILYSKIDILSNIQFPWRMLSTFIFLPPIVIAYFLDKTDGRKLLFASLLLVIFFSVIRFPQLYSKNNTDHPISRYESTKENLHSVNMNTIWSDESENYPVHPEKGAIIGGKGKITQKILSNSWRKYTVENDTAVHMIDYTFYFPGWKVWVDGQPVEIQFQDPAYKGVITYDVPAGKHNIYLKFTDTKVRIVGNIISIISLSAFIIAVLLERKKHYFTSVS